MSQKLYAMGLLSEIDGSALAAYCQAFSRWAEAEIGLRVTGLTALTKEGNEYQHPLVGVANKAMLIMHKFLVEFGMTPSCRTRIVAPGSATKSKWGDL